MSGGVEHEIVDSRTCSCGARFRDHKRLRRHVSVKNRGGEPTVWEATPAPRPTGGSKRCR